MKIKAAHIRHFRNLRSIELEPSRSLNWIVGDNGQGKTNLIEALHVALRGRSFRPYAQKSDWIPSRPEDFRRSQVSLKVEDDRGYCTNLLLRLSESGSWEFFFNEKKASLSKMKALMPVIAFSPDDHALVRGEPEIRRVFLDDVFSDVGPGYWEVSARYQEALKSRNRLLRLLQSEPFHNKNEELMAWSETMAQCGWELILMRREMWPRFEGHFRSIMKKLFRGADQGAQLRYLADQEDLSSAEGLLAHILSDRAKDLHTGWTHRGPHRDDFLVLIEGVASRTQASQGQSRLMALGLKWAHGSWVLEERKEKPIIFVDDFSSEFDASRRSVLMDFLNETQGQLFVTGTEPSLVDSPSFSDYNFYFISGGALKPRNSVEMECLKNPCL